VAQEIVSRPGAIGDLCDESGAHPYDAFALRGRELADGARSAHAQRFQKTVELGGAAMREAGPYATCVDEVVFVVEISDDESSYGALAKI
jgi:hypothetical protein